MSTDTPTRLPQFDVPTAQRYAYEGRLEEWIHVYLNAGYWANPGLSEGLKLQQRWWRGPLEIELSELSRCCGPEPQMKFRMELGAWVERTNSLAQNMTNEPLEFPPLIVEYRQGSLVICDGNTRHAVMERHGWQTCWVLIWYNSEADYQIHGKRL